MFAGHAVPGAAHAVADLPCPGLLGRDDLADAVEGLQRLGRLPKRVLGLLARRDVDVAADVLAHGPVGVDHLGDDEDVVVHSPVGDRGVGVGHVDRADRRVAQREQEVVGTHVAAGLHRDARVVGVAAVAARDAGAYGHVVDVLAAVGQGVGHLHEGGVDRVLHRLEAADVGAVAVTVRVGGALAGGRCGFDLAQALTLRAQFAHTSKLRQRLKVVEEIRRRRRSLDDSLFSPTANRLFAQTEELFDLFDGIGRFDTLVICL